MREITIKYNDNCVIGLNPVLLNMKGDGQRPLRVNSVRPEGLPVSSVNDYAGVVGHTYGYLTVLRRMPKDYGPKAVETLCICGRRKIIKDFSNLKNEYIKSCGCKSVEIRRETMSARPYFERSPVVIGATCGQLTVLEEVDPKFDETYNRLLRRVKVRCDCGVEKNVLWGGIKSKKLASCGCRKKSEMPPIGTKIRHLTLVGEGYPEKGGRRTVNVKCVCGEIKTTRLTRFLCGAIKSCGCMRKYHRPYKNNGNE